MHSIYLYTHIMIKIISVYIILFSIFYVLLCNNCEEICNYSLLSIVACFSWAFHGFPRDGKIRHNNRGLLRVPLSAFHSDNDFLYGLIKVNFVICREMIKHAQAFKEICQLLKASQGNDPVYVSFQYPVFRSQRLLSNVTRGFDRNSRWLCLYLIIRRYRLYPSL